MQFCKECGNMLLPKKKKNSLYCKVCDKEFAIGKEKEKLEEYKKTKKTNAKKKLNARAMKTAIVTEDAASPAISEEERDAYEEYFEMSEMDFSGGS